jgi:hypothetical protein
MDGRLADIVTEQPYPLVFVTISGAHLYGFPSAEGAPPTPEEVVSSSRHLLKRDPRSAHTDYIVDGAR